jgi:hypothetical protein
MMGLRTEEIEGQNLVVKERGVYIAAVLIITKREEVKLLGYNDSLDLCGEEPLA